MPFPMVHRASLRWTAVAACVAFLPGCSDPSGPAPVSPPALQLAGSYAASTFIVERPHHLPVDVLANGGNLTLTIAADSTTSGILFAPTGISGNPSITVSMAGTATLAGTTVTFFQPEETFVRRLPWSLSDSTLSVSHAGVGTTVFTIVLTRR